MRHFCISFNYNYLTRGLALYASLKRHCEAFHLDILCLDEECHQRLAGLSLPECRLILLADLEAADPELLATKATKTIVDYSFTLKPCLIRYLLAEVPKGELLTYLDSDLYFYANPEPIFEEIESGSIGIIPHRFPRESVHMEIHGIYNAGWVSFRNDDEGRACNDWWRERCLEWCYDRLEDGRYADQTYLDGWPSRFPRTVVILHLGVNLAPWNVGQYEIANNGAATTVNACKLIFYHFHALRKVSDRLFDSQLSKYGVDVSKELRQHIYGPYLEELFKVDQRLNAAVPDPRENVAAAPSGSGFELIPRLSGPNSETSTEQEKVDDYLYRNLVLAERDRLAKQAAILRLAQLSARVRDLDRPLLKKILQFSPRLARLLKIRAMTRFVNSTQLGTLRQYKPRKMRLEKFPQASSSANELPSIAIVTPSFMQGAFLGRTIQSVLSQNYPKLSYIIQDGGSKDNSVEIIKACESRLARWESKPDGGQADAIKRGFRGRDEDIMAWLNSDDMLMPGSLPFVGSYFAANPSVDVIYGHRVVIDENDDEVGRWVLPEHDPEILKWADYVPQETLFWRRTVWDKVGGVNTNFDFAIDWDLLLKFRRVGAKVVRLPYFLGCFRVHPQQKTSGAMRNSTGDHEMAQIRKHLHGRVIGGAELLPPVTKFCMRAAMTAHLLSLGIRA